MKKIILKGEGATILFARKIADKLKGGEVILLSGDLGAGKTTFTRGLGKALGVKQNVNSPTFVVMKVYHANTPTVNKFVHIDAYRLESGRDLTNIGASEYFGAEKTVTVIEWPEKIADVLPKNTINISIKNVSEDSREFTVKNNKKTEILAI
ncbi:tRNA (adenosine(37)-N6)-threonylcarbamoyltransferase complex ATPase subunit type 1 TsaE [Candidatus Parcubacteria bacterium]|nr:tRNA (adenosine(37)-N6)-threonylcarbamoyltransferase complex ATPase subunit type 1 TsaE [Patescibacteria group bacterium]MBU4309120.1 tRNA (adenosine(37)-N6)-threonylcarbamoyltransferase complex ATPase subunit type 1 TsaE [Patescibacteria group bacterium]MBU4432716.1 tRNA (adenosine(37)-N6)-threonylcarbamoyltransferase complex ATPase subunit type 1 TsaE [Patescibacteria group bacterium]MBU4577481.1 tRNA (adenosine(37)-N6)-threonylcarbamoyltransferase complex ATPase subunit type 1 TsaE [Patesc